MARFELLPHNKQIGKYVAVVAQMIIVFEHEETDYIEDAFKLFFSKKAAIALFPLAGDDVLP